jgi:hypothetical protein
VNEGATAFEAATLAAADEVVVDGLPLVALVVLVVDDGPGSSSQTASSGHGSWNRWKKSHATADASMSKVV